MARQMAVETGGDAEARLVARLGPEKIARFESCGRLSWVPLEEDLALSNAVEAVLGEGVDYERSRRSTAENMSSPLMRSFLEGARRLFGLDPASALKLVKSGWVTVFKDCGQAAHDPRGPGESVVRITDAPDAMVLAPSYVRALAGAMHGLLDVCEVEGIAEVVQASIKTHVVEIRLRWTQY